MARAWREDRQASGDQLMEGGPPVGPGMVRSPEAFIPQRGEGVLGEEGLLG